MKRLVRPTRAELRKLAHPIVALFLVVAAISIWLDARSTATFAAGQTPTAVAFDARLRADFKPACFTTPLDTSQECSLQRADAASNRYFAANAVRLGRVAASLRTIGGVVRFVTHEFATGIGWLLLALLAAVHVAGEWHNETNELTVLTAGSRSRFLVAKATSLWLVAAAALVGVVTALYATRSVVLPHGVGVPAPPIQDVELSKMHLAALPPDRSWSSVPAALEHAAITLAIMLLLATLFVGVTALLRRPLPSALALGGGLLIVLAVAGWWGHPAWTPVGPIADVLDLRRLPFGVQGTRLWLVPGAARDLYTAPVRVTHATAAVCAWAAAVAVTGIGTIKVFEQRRLT